MLKFNHIPKILLALTAAYFLTSLGHFSHNAEFICEYPNLPAWLTRAQVYAVWAAITSLGVVGLLLMRKKYTATGLLLMAVYAAMGFDGLGHYVFAPIELHPLIANVTILSEVAAAALLLPVVLWLLGMHVFRGDAENQ
ncbi:MAG: hypothetical protein ABIR76_04850 [Polaromonas sp.]